MAGQTEGKPKGTNPALLIVIGVVFLAVAVYRLVPMFSGGGRKPVATAPGSTQPRLAAAAQKPAAETGSKPGMNSVSAVTASDPLSSFLVQFGRANPFASFTGGTYSRSAGASGSGGTIQDLRQRLQNIAGDSGGGARPGEGDGPGFVLKGIVRSQDKVLVVIAKDGKGHIAGIGEPLAKTGYTVKSVDGNKVTISSGDKDTVLVLGGKKP